MSRFVRVDARQAGQHALGILVPPGSRTVIVLRPRGLPWDLLPARWDGDAAQPPRLCTFVRDEAARIARGIPATLERAADNPLQTLGDAQGQAFQVWLRADEFVWLVCRRTPGEAYQPALFATQAEATREAERLTPIFHPPSEVPQEYYFNTQQFVV